MAAMAPMAMATHGLLVSSPRRAPLAPRSAPVALHSAPSGASQARWPPHSPSQSVERKLHGFLPGITLW